MARRTWLGQTALIATLAIASVACGSFGGLKAKKHFKDANGLYTQGEYRKAAAEYEEALKADPQLTAAYFYLANSYDNLYKVARKGEAENDAFLEKAVKNYKLASEKQTDPKEKALSLKFLAAAYGADKLNDPSQAEPVVKQLIEMDPKDTGSYFGLAKLYEDAGRFEEAEGALLKAKDAAPNEKDVYLQLAAFYAKRGDFEKAIAAHEQRAAIEPNNPEAYWTLAAFFEEKVRKDYRLAPQVKRDYILKGITYVDKAIQIKPDFFEAITYKNLLLRQQALVEKDPKRAAELVKEADALRDRAIELRDLKAKGVGA